MEKSRKSFKIISRGGVAFKAFVRDAGVYMSIGMSELFIGGNRASKPLTSPTQYSG